MRTIGDVLNEVLVSEHSMKQTATTTFIPARPIRQSEDTIKLLTKLVNHFDFGYPDAARLMMIGGNIDVNVALDFCKSLKE